MRRTTIGLVAAALVLALFLALVGQGHHVPIVLMVFGQGLFWIHRFRVYPTPAAVSRAHRELVEALSTELAGRPWSRATWRQALRTRSPEVLDALIDHLGTTDGQQAERVVDMLASYGEAARDRVEARFTDAAQPRRRRLAEVLLRLDEARPPAVAEVFE